MSGVPSARSFFGRGIATEALPGVGKRRRAVEWSGRRLALGLSGGVSGDGERVLMLLIPLTSLTVWTLWIDSDQVIKDLNILKDLKILHRKGQSVVRLIERLSTFD
jgi:hypothetical protein